MAGIIKVNQYQDFNGNTLFTSDGSGNLTTMKVNEPYFFATMSANQTGLSDNIQALINLFVLLEKQVSIIFLQQ